MSVRCPQCSRDYVRRTPRDGWFERIASLAYLYPFACQLCAHRFRTFQWGVRYARQPVDRRHYERVQVHFPLTCSTDTGRTDGTILDISMGGCAFKTATPPAPGTLVQLALQATGLPRPLLIEAAVVRSVRSQYVGTEFLRVQPAEQYRLIQFVADLLTTRRLRDDAAAQAGRPREIHLVPQMR
jgi:hypothetical protein